MPKRMPKITRRILEGLSAALSRMRADDLTDLPDDEWEDMNAADIWLINAFAAIDERESKKGESANA